jgi:hypothetical protein
MEKMDNKFDENNKYIRNLSNATIIGIGAMVAAVTGIAITVWLSMSSFISFIPK